MAKQASNLDKRDGLERIDHTNLVSVFERLQLTDLSGIAEASARGLRLGGIQTPLDFLHAPPESLRLAEMHTDHANGWLRSLRGFEVSNFEGAARKSYSHSHVMARATSSQVELEELLMRLSEMVGRGVRAAPGACSGRAALAVPCWRAASRAGRWGRWASAWPGSPRPRRASSISSPLPPAHEASGWKRQWTRSATASAR